MPKQLRITVYGRVQRVGYRDRVAEISRKLGVKGTVKNLEDEVSVEIIAQGDKETLDEFLKEIDIQDYPVEVEKLDVKEEESTEEFKYFKITRGDPWEEVGERMDTAGTILYDMNKRIHSIDNKQDKMLEKQDETINVMKDFSHETHSRFDVMEKKYGKISEKLDKLDKISGSLEKLVDILEAFRPK